jgi:hypothetical protein
MALDFTKVDVTSLAGYKSEIDEPLVQPVVQTLEQAPAPSFTLEDVDQFFDNKLNATMSEAVKVEPNQQAQTNKLSRASGVPTFAVESDPKSVADRLKFESVDLEELQKFNRKTAGFMTNFNNASVAHDDVGILSKLENILDFGRTFENIDETIRIGFSSQAKGLKALAVDRSPSKIVDLIPDSALPVHMQALGGVSDITGEKLSKAFAKNFGIETDEQLQAAKVEAVDRVIGEIRELKAERFKLTPDDLNLLEQGVRAGVESLANMAPGVGLAILSGGMSAPLLGTIGVQSFAQSYGEGREGGLTAQEAGYFAGIDAAIEVGTELLPTKTLETIITGASKGLKKDALKFAVREMGTEQLATIGQSLNQYAFGLDDQMEQAESVGEMVNIQLQRQAVTAIATVVAGGTQISAASAINKIGETIAQNQQKKQVQSEVEQDKIDQINKTSTESKLKERDSETFKQFVEEADGDNNTNVFIDGVQASLFLGTKTPDEIVNDPGLSLINEQVREAARTGGDVVIPVADFSTEIAGTETFDALRDSMTLSGETIPPFRQVEDQQATESYIQNLVNEAEETVSSYVESQEIFEDVRAQLVDTGMVTPQNATTMAQVVPAWATVFAKEQGITVTEAYQNLGVIEGPQTGKREELGDVFKQDTPMFPDDNLLTNINKSGPVWERIEESNPEIVGKGDDDLVTVYRATIGDELRFNDFVALNREVAESHLESLKDRGEVGKIITREVPVNSLRMANDATEFVYTPETLKQTSSELVTAIQNDVKGLKLSTREKDNILTLDKIIVPEDQRNLGTGTNVMTQLVEWADTNGKTIALTPSTDFGGSKKRLKEFYKRSGFVENKGENKNFETQETLIREPQQPLKQEDQQDKKAVTKGFYDPANSVIRLTEAADLSTFLHEFAHFMYEMEVKADSDRLQSINNWYKRNNEAVAKDANVLLGGTSTSKEVARDQGFNVDTVMYHGTPVDFSEFDRKKISSTSDPGIRGRGFYFSFNRETAASYAVTREGEPGVIKQVYLKTENPLNLLSFSSKDELADHLGIDNSILKERVDELPSGTFRSISVTPKFTGVFTSAVKDKGYDSIVHDQEVVVFNPSQIRTTDSISEGVTPEDVNIFLDNNTTGDTSKDKAIRTAVHEQFARGFEIYLMEGKAPSIELRNAFQTFARWLANIYRALKDSAFKNVTLDNEMRAVFDRLLATEEQLQAAEIRAKYEPMFTDAAMAGMTEAEFQAYQERVSKVKDKQSETLRDKVIAQLTRQTKAWWKEEKLDFIDGELATLSKQRVYVAGAALKAGEPKLDLAATKAMVGEARTDKIGRTTIRVPNKLRGMTVSGAQGVHPDEAAAFLGYASGSEMLQDIITAPDIKDVAESNAEARMVEKYGDILNDGTIEKEADEAVQNEERGKLILNELKVIARGTGQPTIERQTIKSIAEQRIGNLSFREIHPASYRRAEIKAAQESAEMLAAGNKEGAAVAKTRQALNYYLGMAATEAKNETMKIVDRMGRYNKKKVREEIQKAEGGFWDQLVKILERFEFRKSATLKEVDQVNENIQVWMNDRNNNEGDGLVLTNPVLNEGYKTHWKNVPFNDLQGINDSVKNIEHVARYSNKITRGEEERDFKALVADWVQHMDSVTPAKFKPTRLDVVKGRNWGRWAMAQMTKIPFMASWLDGGERAGMSHDVLVQPFTDAYREELDLWEEVGTPVMQLIENRDKETIARHNQKVFIPAIDDHLMVHQILAVALNTGNQGNLKKMLLGEGWANPEIETDISMDNPKLQAVLSHLQKSDWEMVQKIWDQMDLLYPKLAEVHRKTTGLVPPKVEATPVETRFGTFRGGYYPVKYDPNRSLRAAENEDRLNAETESMFSNSASIQASVNTGATNARTGFYDAIRLSLDVVPAHFQESIHYITHHDAVRQTNKLVRSKPVATTIKEKLGPEEYAQLRPWLNDIAKDGREAPTKTFIDSILQRLRFGTTLGVMGFKASTGIIQISGLSNTIAEVGLGPVMQSMRSILGSTTDMKKSWDFAIDNSKVMKNRAKTMDREIKNALKDLSGSFGFVGKPDEGPLVSAIRKSLSAVDSNRVLKGLQETSMKHIALIQTYMVDLPSWHAAYIKNMGEYGDEQRAFRYADWVVENVQGSGATKDLTLLTRSQKEPMKMFTMFMTFFSSLWNMQRDLVKGAKSGRYSTTNVAAKSMFLFSIPVLFEMLMRGELGGEDEDAEEQLQKYLTKVAMYPVQSIPFIRDLASGLSGDFGYNISPIASLLEQGTRTIPEVVKRGFTDEDITKGQAKGATRFIGATLGIPGVNQAWATGEHLFDVIEEGEELTMHQLLFGPER